MFPFQCRKIESEDELRLVYRLRYAIYVEEMGRPQRYVDPERRCLAEPLDETAVHLGAFESRVHEQDVDEDWLVGALRIHVLDRSGIDSHPPIYDRVTRHETERFALVTRLVTRKDVRGGKTSAGVALALEAYRVVLEEGVETAFVDCQSRIAPLFEWLGFDEVDDLVHPDFGPISVLRIRIHDFDRLERTNSPLRPILEASRLATGDAHAERLPCPVSKPLESLTS